MQSYRCASTQILQLLVFCSTKITLHVQAFGRVGHQIVANVAWDLLTPVTQSRVQTILDQSATYYNLLYADSNCHDCTPLGIFANWADAVRDSSKAASQHFNVKNGEFGVDCSVLDPEANFTAATSSDCHFVLSRDCPDSDCVVAATVDASADLLADTSRANENSRRRLIFTETLVGWLLGGRSQSRETLMALTHWVADAHQPLHCSRETDRGGNDIYDRVTFLDVFSLFCGIPILGSLVCIRLPLDLHDIWDDSIIEEIVLGVGSRQSLEADIREADVDTGCGDSTELDCVVAWADESMEAALKYAYRNVDGSEIVDGTVLGTDYFNVAEKVIRERLALAAKRLAATLEVALAKFTTILTILIVHNVYPLSTTLGICFIGSQRQ